MKHLFYFSFLLLISLTAVHAQKPITLYADSAQFGNRYFPGFWLSIPETKPEIIKARWIKAIEKGTKSKVTVENNEMTLFGAIIPDFYPGNVNITSKVMNQDSLVMLFVSVETTRDNFIGNTSSEYDKLSKYLKEFGKDQYVAVAKDQLSAEMSKLKVLEKELKSSRKSKSKSEKGIQSSKIRITQQNDKINGINKELDILEIRIGNCTSSLSTLEDGDAKKAKQSELKDLQKKKKSLLKNISSAENSISKANNTIQDYTKDIELFDATQNELMDKIVQQKLVMAKFQNKLKAIEAF